jgi:DNA-binding response OmpR family regulator
MVSVSGDTTRTLVVDDDSLVRSVLRAALERIGHEVTEAPAGDIAVSLSGTGSFDLVIVDARMPGLSLDDTLAGIRGALEPHQPGVLVISGAPVDGQLLETHSAGYLTKPIDLRDFLSAVRLAVAS